MSAIDKLKNSSGIISFDTTAPANTSKTVKAGESMYIISQLYGIRLKYLYKMNGLTPDYQIEVGDELRVR